MSVHAPCSGHLYVVSGPSGVGKDTVLDLVMARLPGVVRSVSSTTRDRRPAEKDGVDYHFVTRSQFETGIRKDLFLEYASYGPDLYGTPRKSVAELRAQGLDVILKIEVKGALRIRQLNPHAILVFIEPPSMEELERRLRIRESDSEESIQDRLSVAGAEMSCKSQYDYLIINDELDKAVEALSSVIIAERCRLRKTS